MPPSSYLISRLWFICLDLYNLTQPTYLQHKKNKICTLQSLLHSQHLPDHSFELLFSEGPPVEVIRQPPHLLHGQERLLKPLLRAHRMYAIFCQLYNSLCRVIYHAEFVHAKVKLSVGSTLIPQALRLVEPFQLGQAVTQELPQQV